ncbi:MAG: hypothetical protein ACRD1E_02760, partial [Terriglobales bacterium]
MAASIMTRQAGRGDAAVRLGYTAAVQPEFLPAGMMKRTLAFVIDWALLGLPSAVGAVVVL